MTTKIDHYGCGLRCVKNMEIEIEDLKYKPIPHGPTQGVVFVVVVSMRRSLLMGFFYSH
jgi:hypothetical protein